MPARRERRTAELWRDSGPADLETGSGQTGVGCWSSLKGIDNEVVVQH